MNDFDFINNIISLLSDVAAKSQVEHKISAVLLQNGKIISHPECNRYFNSSVCKAYTIHAEISVIKRFYRNNLYCSPYMNTIKINGKLKKIDLVVIRVNASGKLMNSRPCLYCLQLMKAVGIRNVYYSTPETIVKESVKTMVSTHITSGWRKCQMM
jgi:tRNA(Arg) A34 adenosine deaminase TadA